MTSHDPAAKGRRTIGMANAQAVPPAAGPQDQGFVRTRCRALRQVRTRIAGSCCGRRRRPLKAGATGLIATEVTSIRPCQEAVASAMLRRRGSSVDGRTWLIRITHLRFATLQFRPPARRMIMAPPVLLARAWPPKDGHVPGGLMRESQIRIPTPPELWDRAPCGGNQGFLWRVPA